MKTTTRPTMTTNPDGTFSLTMNSGTMIALLNVVGDFCDEATKKEITNMATSDGGDEDGLRHSWRLMHETLNPENFEDSNFEDHFYHS